MNMQPALEFFAKAVCMLRQDKPILDVKDQELVLKIVSVMQKLLVDFHIPGDLMSIWHGATNTINSFVQALEGSPPHRKRKFEQLKQEAAVKQMNIAKTRLAQTQTELLATQQKQLVSLSGSEPKSAEEFTRLAAQLADNIKVMKALEKSVGAKQDRLDQQTEFLNLLILDQQENAARCQNLQAFIAKQEEQIKAQETETERLAQIAKRAEKENERLLESASRAENELKKRQRQDRELASLIMPSNQKPRQRNQRHRKTKRGSDK